MINPDVAAIRSRMISSGRRFASYARVRGICVGTFESFIQGRYLPGKGRAIERIMACLKEDGLWVESATPRVVPRRKTHRRRARSGAARDD